MHYNTQKGGIIQLNKHKQIEYNFRMLTRNSFLIRRIFQCILSSLIKSELIKMSLPTVENKFSKPLKLIDRNK